MRSDMDFLNVGDREFDTLEEVTFHIRQNVNVTNFDGDLSVIGSVCDFDSTDEFVHSLESHFSLERQNGNLLLLNAKEFDVPYYVFLSNEFPIFFTTGRKTRDFPETINAYFKGEQNIGRLWISKREMENLRQRVVNKHPDVIIPYFTATRSRHSEVEANRRPRFERTFQYYAKDGLDTFNELKYEYGVLPTNIKFQKTNEFKFRVTTRGVFTINNGGLEQVLTVIEDSIERLREVKKAIDTSGFSTRTNKYTQSGGMAQSRPWAVELSHELTDEDVQQFEGEVLQEDWEFDLSELDVRAGDDRYHFSAELIDERTLGKTILRSNENSIRIYPREDTGIDQSIRVFEFINDQIDPKSIARKVA
ncbi:hypothetical protein [Natranaeroarchaeum aerophilus]|uniref:Uncharacterized protein n=1 Tax=Natranaeroarchaeum aerophilus TaxID=2917711 RepID=A0AAE3K5X5_9EURY|nr:hypothetical protein [Natranaeroarchaeum aerophilus]MCL9814408.1 hypothetical protein [Natranaeroarchaeum aerophilus]